MVELKFKPKQSDCQAPALQHCTTLSGLGIVIYKNKHDHCKWRWQVHTHESANTGKRKAEEEARNRS